MIESSVVAQVLKQFPPSASQLQCLDIGDQWRTLLLAARPDMVLTPVSVLPTQWDIAAASVDAVVAWDIHLSETLLHSALRVLRPGGRFIVANPFTPFDEYEGQRLTAAGWVRLLLEPLDSGRGLLLRGERPHLQPDTQARIEQTAQADADHLTLDTYRGRFVHLLVRQTPNKPVWKLTPDDVITWHTLTDQGVLLAFTSMPKAVAFMQTGVLNGRVYDVNRIARFRREVVQDWPLQLNPTFDDLSALPFGRLPINPALAEAPDE